MLGYLYYKCMYLRKKFKKNLYGNKMPQQVPSAYWNLLRPSVLKEGTAFHHEVFAALNTKHQWKIQSKQHSQEYPSWEHTVLFKTDRSYMNIYLDVFICLFNV